MTYLPATLDSRKMEGLGNENAKIKASVLVCLLPSTPLSDKSMMLENLPGYIAGGPWWSQAPPHICVSVAFHRSFSGVTSGTEQIWTKWVADFIINDISPVSVTLR